MIQSIPFCLVPVNEWIAFYINWELLKTIFSEWNEGYMASQKEQWMDQALGITLLLIFVFVIKVIFSLIYSLINTTRHSPSHVCCWVLWSRYSRILRYSGSYFSYKNENSDSTWDKERCSSQLVTKNKKICLCLWNDKQCIYLQVMHLTVGVFYSRCDSIHTLLLINPPDHIGKNSR